MKMGTDGVSRERERSTGVGGEIKADHGGPVGGKSSDTNKM